ncbi:hypothetical protein [Paracoccus spongiarum]|uniref:Lipopolysaccharide biosynthesis protein n=1 Tax=Paracoccus spongiarum TaxID=3064387 RepID=A0ABT9JCH6_9RHOB|nr:hypothetical protein [Paracoccus sp. 2205BS29-5]MDP5307521.1 hypothetical protein [Paracoccus sp. 2205BS29-5]
MIGRATTAARSGEGAAGLVDSLLLIGARIGANLLALVWTMLLVRMIQPELSGIAFRAIAMAQIGSILLTMNVESGSVRALVPAMQAGRLDEAAGFLRFNRRIILTSLPILAALTALWHLSGIGGASPALTLAIAAAMVMCAVARMTARHATALGVMRKGLLPRLLTGPLVLSAGLGLALLLGLQLMPWHVAALFGLSEALTVLVQRRLLRVAFAPFAGRRPAATAWRDWLSLGLWLSPGLLMTEYRKAVLIASAGLLLPSAQLSLFAVALSIMNIVNFGVVAVDVAFSPRIARAMAADDPARRDRMLAVSGAIKLAGLLLAAVLLALLGRWALDLFGAEYRAAWPALLVLMAIPAGSILFGPASVLLSSRGMGRADFTGNVLGAALLVGVVAAGSALSGLTGAAAGAAAGHLLSQAIMAGLCRRRLGIDSSLATLRHLAPAPRLSRAAT